MKFSIIIPSYNQAPYLSDAIESALAQSFKDYEVIVIDDGSTDNSLEIAKKYPVKVISQVNKGLASARNTGIMNAEGEWIFPLDADDIMEEKCLERINENISAEVDIIAPSFKCFGVYNETVILQGATLKDFAGANRIGYFSAVRKSKLLEVGGYNPKMIYGFEDYHIWFNLLSRGARLKVLPEVLMLYRTKPESMIHSANRHADELILQIKKDFPHVF